MGGRGRFITIEGGDGAGKSTLRDHLAAALRRAGIDVVATREPGGTPAGEAVRALVLTGTADRWDPLAETLLFMAARRMHLVETIWPALERGAWVVCDRYADSTRVYQGVGKGLDAALIEHVQAMVDEGRAPDLTLILDLPAETGLARARGRSGGRDGQGDRFEALDTAFHARLNEGFRTIAARAPARCALLDAQLPASALADAALAVLADRLGPLG